MTSEREKEIRRHIRDCLAAWKKLPWWLSAMVEVLAVLDECRQKREAAEKERDKAMLDCAQADAQAFIHQGRSEAAEARAGAAEKVLREIHSIAKDGADGEFRDALERCDAIREIVDVVLAAAESEEA